MRKKVTKKAVIPKVDPDDVMEYIEELDNEGKTKHAILVELTDKFGIKFDEALDYYNGFLSSK
jgi:hypothetical protein